MSADKAFVDTNILIYAHDLGAGSGYQIARELIGELWRGMAGAVSTHMLEQLCVNAHRRVFTDHSLAPYGWTPY